MFLIFAIVSIDFAYQGIDLIVVGAGYLPRFTSIDMCVAVTVAIAY